MRRGNDKQVPDVSLMINDAWQGDERIAYLL